LKAVAEYDSIINMGGGLTDDLAVIRNEAERFNVQIQSITHEGNSIQVICDADSYTVFREFLTALEESGRFLSPIPEPDPCPAIEQEHRK